MVEVEVARVVEGLAPTPPHGYSDGRVLGDSHFRPQLRTWPNDQASGACDSLSLNGEPPPVRTSPASGS
jgi:hypothetical protein